MHHYLKQTMPIFVPNTKYVRLHKFRPTPLPPHTSLLTLMNQRVLRISRLWGRTARIRVSGGAKEGVSGGTKEGVNGVQGDGKKVLLGFLSGFVFKRSTLSCWILLCVVLY